MNGRKEAERNAMKEERKGKDEREGEKIQRVKQERGREGKMNNKMEENKWKERGRRFKNMTRGKWAESDNERREKGSNEESIR